MVATILWVAATQYVQGISFCGLGDRRTSEKSVAVAAEALEEELESKAEMNVLKNAHQRGVDGM